LIINDLKRVSTAGIPLTSRPQLPRDMDAPDMMTRKRRPQLEQAAPGCRWSKFPTGIQLRRHAVSCRAVSCRHDTDEGDVRGTSIARKRRRSSGTGAVSAQCGARSRVRVVCRHCGTARHRRCTCSGGLRAQHGHDDGGGSWC